MQNKLKSIGVKSFFLIAFAILISACSNETKIVETIPSEANSKMEAKITGMSCEMGCVTTIKNKLSKIKGVYSSEINFEQKQAVIEFNTQQISAKEIVDEIEKLNEKMYKVEQEKTTCIKDCKEVSPSHSTNSNGSSNNSNNDKQVSSPLFHLPNIFSILSTLIQ